MELDAKPNEMFPMSPLNSRNDDSEGSVSFNGSKKMRAAGSGNGSAMSTDSSIRAPYGEQLPNFEFRLGKQTGNVREHSKPFSTLHKQADSGMSQDQGTPAPATPASVTGESQGTPTVINTPASTPAPPAAGATNHPLVWSEILLWHEPLQTAVVFLGGLLAFGLLTFAAYGTHQMTLVSGLAYLLLLDVGANFFRYFVSKPWHDKCLWGGAAQMKNVLTRVNSLLLHLAAAHDRYLSAVDPVLTLKVAVVLWTTAWVGSFLSLWSFALLAYVGAFTLPVAYQAAKGQLAAAAKSVRAGTIVSNNNAV
eukprot:GHRR01007501.1.p1 GENE.GHRR01007501.1~~GHRR01007501.1.p1  ORF type:complete len:308 (+),score=98.45 GHRR01007501.1:213-1136(+)